MNKVKLREFAKEQDILIKKKCLEQYKLYPDITKNDDVENTHFMFNGSSTSTKFVKSIIAGEYINKDLDEGRLMDQFFAIRVRLASIYFGNYSWHKLNHRVHLGKNYEPLSLAEFQGIQAYINDSRMCLEEILQLIYFFKKGEFISGKEISRKIRALASKDSDLGFLLDSIEYLKKFNDMRTSEAHNASRLKKFLFKDFDDSELEALNYITGVILNDLLSNLCSMLKGSAHIKTEHIKAVDGEHPSGYDTIQTISTPFGELTISSQHVDHE